MKPTKDSTEERLLEAAGQTFAERGYDGASVRDICDRAGANIAAVNYHFGGKERLYIEAVKRACGRRLEGVAPPAWPPGTPPAVKLRAFVRAFVERVVVDDHNPAWQRELMMRELTRPTEACVELAREVIRPQFELLSGIVREALPRLPEARVHLTVFSIIGQCVHHALARPIVRQLVGAEEHATYTADRLAQHIAEFSLAALGLGKPLKSPKEAHA